MVCCLVEMTGLSSAALKAAMTADSMAAHWAALTVFWTAVKSENKTAAMMVAMMAVALAMPTAAHWVETMVEQKEQMKAVCSDAHSVAQTAHHWDEMTVVDSADSMVGNSENT
jgi:hypothetical protein